METAEARSAVGTPQQPLEGLPEIGELPVNFCENGTIRAQAYRKQIIQCQPACAYALITEAVDIPELQVGDWAEDIPEHSAREIERVRSFA
jgi:hypothetical protein